MAYIGVPQRRFTVIPLNNPVPETTEPTPKITPERPGEETPATPSTPIKEPAE